jgi:hypothetical protein
MKLTIKQLRTIIKEELENTLIDSNSNNINIKWGNGEVEVENDNSKVTYPIIITSGNIKIKTWVTYDYDFLDEPTCSMVEEGNFEQIGGEDLEEEEFFKLLQKMEREVLTQASKKEFVQDAKDTIEDDLSDRRDREEFHKDPDAYYGVKGQFR